jgi:uncharacterized protein
MIDPVCFVDIAVDPEEMNFPDAIRKKALAKAGMPDTAEVSIRIIRRSVDARSRMPKFILRVAVGSGESAALLENPFHPRSVGDRRVVIVGAGPGGYFSALTLLEYGIRPIILERGRDVLLRRKDLKKIYSQGLVHPHSNYCFGEGGAGAYSDGKLYTRATKRGDVNRILKMFASHGASPDILIDAHPHIGSNVLPGVVRCLRESIIGAGGEIRFNAFVDDLVINDGKITGVRVNGDEFIPADAVILATGHSARDIYRMLETKGLALEAKPFALGVRIEHPQEVIDGIFYHQLPRHAGLPPAAYRVACEVEGRGVFSFCMCPGGFVIPASTAPGELVLNGMSMSGRGGAFANAGLVVEVRLEDVGKPEDPLSAMVYQEWIEKTVFEAGDKLTQKAPAQRAMDFVQGKISGNLGNTSYIPGIYPAPLHELLPGSVTSRLRSALVIFGKKYKGYDTREALLMAVESRTSSPVRIIRDPKTLMHPQADGLFPCGEGAGYAGGIVSAAMDGEAVANAVARKLAGP